MKTVLDRLFPHWKIRNVAMFYVLAAVNNAWFVAAVWVFIWGKFMTKTQMGISDSITFTIGFLIELPSGVWADLIGRRKAILWGNILLAVGNFLVGLSSHFISLTVWYLVWTIGYAMQSGTTEALAYDSLKKFGDEKEWSKVISTYTIISRATTLACTALGGFLFTLGFRLPYLVAGIVGVIGVVAAYYLQEIKIRDKTEAWSTSLFLNQTKDGLANLVKKNVAPFAIVALSVAAAGYIYNWGLPRPLAAERFGYTPTAFSILLACVSLMVIVGVSLFNKIKNTVDTEKILFWVGMLFAVVYFSIGFNHDWVIGGFLMIILAVLLVCSDIFFSEFINRHTRAEHRATTLSAVALFTKMPYVLIAFALGKIADANQLPLFMKVMGIGLLCICGLGFFLLKKSKVSTRT